MTPADHAERRESSWHEHRSFWELTWDIDDDSSLVGSLMVGIQGQNSIAPEFSVNRADLLMVFIS